MKKARDLFRWLLLLAVVIASAPSVLPAAAQDDAETAEGVAPYRAQVRLQRSVYGPESGVLVHDPDVIAFAPAEVDLRNFYARVRVTVPYDAAEQPWDAGLSFRIGRDTSWRVVVSSEGRWYAGLGGNVIVAEGELDALSLELDDVNEIEVVADGNTGYLAVNREEVGSFDLSRRLVSGDIAVGTTYSAEAVSPGSEMAFSRFQIWELDDEAEPADIPPAAEALMEDGRDRADLDEPIGGPLDGELIESGESINIQSLQVETTDFYARASFTNPRDGAEQPFDIGFGFRDTGGDNQYRLVIASDGTWYFRYGVEAVLAAGELDGFNADAGASNVIELAVQGDLGVFAVNGDIVSALDLSAVSDAGNIAIGVGFYPDIDVVEGEVTEFADFAAWALDDSPVLPGATATPGDDETATPEEEVTVTAEPTEAPLFPDPTEAAETPEPTEEVDTPEATEEVEIPEADETPEPVDDETAFENAIDSTRSLPIIFGPADGDLVLEPETLAFANADVDLTDFIARVQFVNPYSATEAIWDYGILFRLGDEDGHYRLIVVSTGEWFLTVGVGDPVASGTLEDLNVRAGQRNTVTLVVSGDVGYLGVNNVYVATFDLSDVSQSGDIALGSSFFQGSYLDGGVTGYQDFVIWEVEGSDRPDVEPTEEPEPDETPRAGDNVYESPTYGYSVTYGDSWEIIDESSEDGVDYVRFNNGISSIDFQSFESDFTPQECLDDEFEYYQTGEGFSDAQVALDVEDREMAGELEDGVWGVFWFTFTSDGESTDYAAYVECRSLDDGVMLRIVQFVPFDDYNDEIEARVGLLDGFSQSGGSTTDLDVPSDQETPEADATTEPEDDTPAGGDTNSALVRIEEVGGSGIDGLATVDADGERAVVRILLLGAPDDTIVLIQEGNCADLSGDPAFLLSEIQAGLSETSVPASVDELVEGGYAITVHVSLTDLTEPVACGPIALG